MTDVINVRNPRTGKHDYEICVATAEVIEPMAKGLRNNQCAWQSAVKSETNLTR